VVLDRPRTAEPLSSSLEASVARVDPRNTTRYWHDAQVAGLSCLHADFTAHDYAPHSHDALVVAVTELGGAEFRSRGRVDEATSSVLLIFNPDEPHSGRMGRSRRWRYRSLYLGERAIGAVARTIGVETLPYFTRNVFADADLIDAFLRLHRRLDEGRDRLAAHELLVDSLGTLFRRHGSAGRQIAAAPHDRSMVAGIIELMRARYAESLTLDELGAAARLTQFQLIGLFKRVLGLTPHAYLTQLRLEAAIRSLKAGTPLAETALAAGFYDQSALNKHFKRCYGITPRQFARATRN
jgi:AraC-like DNA-binding protein